MWVLRANIWLLGDFGESINLYRRDVLPSSIKGPPFSMEFYKICFNGYWWYFSSYAARLNQYVKLVWANILPVEEMNEFISCHGILETGKIAWAIFFPCDHVRKYWKRSPVRLGEIIMHTSSNYKFKHAILGICKTADFGRVWLIAFGAGYIH